MGGMPSLSPLSSLGKGEYFLIKNTSKTNLRLHYTIFLGYVMLSLLKQTCFLLPCERFDQRKVCQGNFYTKKTAASETILLVEWLHLICNNVHYLQVFNANDGRDDIVKHSLVGIVRARFIRFRPTEFSTGKALRVEVYGILTTTGKLCKDSCSECRFPFYILTV